MIFPLLIFVILQSSIHISDTAKRLGKIDSLKQIALKTNK